MNNEFFCREFRQDDKEDVQKLVKSTFSIFLKGKFWNWKYGENPSFDPRLVAVAEANGQIVGYCHWLLRELKYSSSVVGKAVLGAEMAVRPDYRRRGIGSQLLQFLYSSNIVKNKKVALVYAFIDLELARKFFIPIGKFILARDGTAQYTKVLNWKKVKRSMKRLNEEIRSGNFGKNLPKGGLKVLFKMSAAPPLCIHINKDGLVVDERRDLGDDADIMVSGDLSVFSRIKMSKRRKWSILKALLTGKLKIRVKLTKLLSFFDTLWILDKVFREKMT